MGGGVCSRDASKRGGEGGGICDEAGWKLTVTAGVDDAGDAGAPGMAEYHRKVVSSRRAS